MHFMKVTNLVNFTVLKTEPDWFSHNTGTYREL